MKGNIKEIKGNWDLGVVVDKHSLHSVITGQNPWGHNTYDTVRTEVGEALFQLKYRLDWSKVYPLANCLFTLAYPRFERVGFIIPMPASTVRQRQPVTEIAQTLARLADKPFSDKILLKTPGDVSLKNLKTKQEKKDAIRNRFYINPYIVKDGSWNVLLIDDLYHTGASMEAACEVLRRYNKINKIYVAARTWR